VSTEIANRDTSQADLDRLSEVAADVLRRCKAAGADQAEVAASIDAGLSVSVRLGDVETIEHTRDRSFGVTVYFGQRKGSASTADLNADSIRQTVEQACAIARYTEADPAAGLGDAQRMARSQPEFDLWHPWDLSVEQAIDIGIEIEDAGRAVPRIVNSEGASVQASQAMAVYANSHGFLGRERGTRQMLSVSLLAEDEAGMQSAYWYDSVRSVADFMPAAEIGRRAAERAVSRLGARSLSTRQCPVLFEAETARSLIGHLISAVSGGALYRKASFLLDACGQRVLPDFVDLIEDPHLLRGHGSAAFDAEGVTTTRSALVEGGVLQRYVLSSYSARKLGLSSTGNAGGIHNLVVSNGGEDFAALLKKLDTGLLVTDVMGQGVNTVTGDYSRGASGFWVENGVIAYPVDEITIAANLRDMLQNILAIGADVDPRSHLLCGSILVGRMTVAGT
jgi:PmbA protein